MASLADLTLVIPAYNRPAYLGRQIDFWSSTDVRLCILDGSKEAASQSLIDRMGPNVYYRHLPIGFNERLVMACDLVQTKYVALLGDDELYAPHGLQDCITQLDEDMRLIACVGRTLFFFERDGAIYGHQAYEKSADLEHTFGNGIERLHESLIDITKGPYLLYGLFRTTEWRKVVRIAYGRKYASGYVYEFAFHLIATLLGPSKMVESLVWMRSGENPAMSSTAVNRKIGLGEWGTDPKYISEVSYLAESVVTTILTEGEYIRDELQSAVSQAVQKFVEYSLHKRKRPIAYWHRLLYFLARQTPKFVKQLIKKKMSPGLGKVLDYRGVPIVQALRIMRAQGISVNAEEMQQIEVLLLAFHQKIKNS